MAVRIVEVELTTNYTWADIKKFKSWEVVKNTNSSFGALCKTSEVSKDVKIKVEVREGTWESVNKLLPSWDFVMNEFASWNELKNW